ncbi:MAG: hypothetical protein R2747_19600 [Pyrinomonadaceae bacterium]
MADKIAIRNTTEFVRDGKTGKFVNSGPLDEFDAPGRVSKVRSFATRKYRRKIII